MAQRDVGSQNSLSCKNTEAKPAEIKVAKPDWKKELSSERKMTVKQVVEEQQSS